MGASTRLALCGHSVPSHPGLPRRGCDECDPKFSERHSRRLEIRVRPERITCEACGALASVPPRGRVPQFCSHSCWSAVKRRKPRGACEYCGSELDRAGKRFCSTLCGEIARGERLYGPRPAPTDSPCVVDGCERGVRARGLCSGHYNQQYQPNRHRSYAKECEWCGASHSSSRSTWRFCSLLCRDGWRALVAGKNVCELPESHRAHQRWRDPDRLLPAVRVVAPVLPRPVAARRWVGGKCAHCGKWYIAEDYSASARYCSLRCARSVAKHRYRARKKSAYVADVWAVQIFVRDRWRCQLCGRAVRRDVSAPHPKAAVLDHIIPLAVGGTHEPANVQLAHFLCNSRKGARPVGEQLLLIG